MLEPVLAQREQSSPSVEMGLRLSDIGELRLPGKGDTVPYSGGGRPLELEAVLAVFRDERYLLFWAQGRGRAVLKEGCSGTDKVKALWQVRAPLCSASLALHPAAAPARTQGSLDDRVCMRSRDFAYDEC